MAAQPTPAPVPTQKLLLPLTADELADVCIRLPPRTDICAIMGILVERHLRYELCAQHCTLIGTRNETEVGEIG